MHLRGCDRLTRLRSDCSWVAVRTRTDMGCHSFTRRTNLPSSTTEESPPWLASFLSGKWCSLRPPVSSRKVQERKSRPYGFVDGLTGLRLHNGSILPARRCIRDDDLLPPRPRRDVDGQTFLMLLSSSLWGRAHCRQHPLGTSRCDSDETQTRPPTPRSRRRAEHLRALLPSRGRASPCAPAATCGCGPAAHP